MVSLVKVMRGRKVIYNLFPKFQMRHEGFSFYSLRINGPISLDIGLFLYLGIQRGQYIGLSACHKSSEQSEPRMDAGWQGRLASDSQMRELTQI